MKKYLTLEQNLPAARIFLNFFGLVLEDKSDIEQGTILKIFDRNNSCVGNLYFIDGTFRIKCKSSLGNISALYNMATYDVNIDTDPDFYGWDTQVLWFHNINFCIDGEFHVNGEMAIGASVDTILANNCGICTKMNYVDKKGKSVELEIMDNGTKFNYKDNKDKRSEELGIICDSYFRMNHSITDDGIHVFKHDYASMFIGGKNCFRCINLENEGLQFHDDDPSFSKKISDIVNDFRTDDISFLGELISASYEKFDERKRIALFGIEIDKVKYYNGKDNLIDAYFYTPNGEKEISDEIIRKVLKK